MVHAKRDEIFTVGEHSFDSKEVCSSGRFRGDKWIGPPRYMMKGKFDRWAKNLCLGCAVRGDGAKNLEYIGVQTAGGYQNAYVFAEHESTTAPLWDGIKARRMPTFCDDGGTCDLSPCLLFLFCLACFCFCFFVPHPLCGE